MREDALESQKTTNRKRQEIFPALRSWSWIIAICLCSGVNVFAFYVSSYPDRDASKIFRLVHIIPLCFLLGFAIGEPRQAVIGAGLLSLCISIGLTAGMQFPAGKGISGIKLLFLVWGSLCSGILGWLSANCRLWVTEQFQKHRLHDSF